MKIFINITTHQHVPYKTEASNDLDLSKTMYMCVNTPNEYQNEKDGNYCVIYDVVVHPSEVYICTIDSTGAARDRVRSLSFPPPLGALFSRNITARG